MHESTKEVERTLALSGRLRGESHPHVTVLARSDKLPRDASQRRYKVHRQLHRAQGFVSWEMQHRA